MSSQNPETNGKRRLFVCKTCCSLVLLLFLGLILWIASGFVFWKQCQIPLPDGSGSVVYMARLNKIVCAEYDRQIRFDTTKFRGRVKYVPGDSAGGSPVNVYWYPARNGKGPYLRFQDPLAEYLADLRTGKTLMLVRGSKENAYAGEIRTQWPGCGIMMYGPVEDIGPADGATPKKQDKKEVYTTEEAYVEDRPAQKLEPWLASKPGEYLGKVEYPYNHFIPKKEAPETPIPKQ